MKCNAVPYNGNEPFLFFSYCHQDSKLVYPVIEELTRRGFRIWYDDGISIGEEWPEVIAQKLTDCAVFFCAVSEAYCASHNCKNELTFRIEDKKPVVAALIQSFVLPLGVRLQLSSNQQMMLHDKPLVRWADEIAECEKLQPCKGAPIHVPVSAQEDLKPAEKPKMEPVQRYSERPKQENPKIPVREIFIEPVQEKAELFIPQEKLNAEEMYAEATVTDVRPAIQSQKDADGELILVISTQNGSGEYLPYNCVETCNVLKLRDILIQKKDSQFRIQKRTDKDAVVVDGISLNVGEDMPLNPGSCICVNDMSAIIAWGESAQWLEQTKELHTLSFADSGEIKAILSNGLALGRRHKWNSGAMKDMRIGREHGRLYLKNGAMYFEDTSRNGSYVNEELLKKVSPETGMPVGISRILSDGDSIRMGGEKFNYHVVSLQLGNKLEKAYQDAHQMMQAAQDEAAFAAAAEAFIECGTYKEAQQLAEKCQKQANRLHCDGIYAEALAISGEHPEAWQEKIKLLRTIPGWKDAHAKVLVLQEKIQTYRQKQENYRIAVSAMEKQQYAVALELFEKLPGWEQADAFCNVCKEMLRLKPKTLETVAANEEHASAESWTVSPDEEELTAHEKTGSMFEEDDATVCIARTVPPAIVNLKTGELYTGKLPSTKIGRKANMCDIVFAENAELSRCHVEIIAQSGKNTIKDCNSSNGTVVNGVALKAGSAVVVGESAIIEIAGIRLLVAFDKTAAVLRNGTVLRYLKLQDGSCDFLTEPYLLAMVDLDATVKDGMQMKKQCAKIIAEAEKTELVITDWESIRVNGEVPSGECCTLASEDEIICGEEKISYHSLKLIRIPGL